MSGWPPSATPSAVHCSLSAWTPRNSPGTIWRRCSMTGPPREARHEAWIGPATDGGFWALALRRPDGDLIRGVPMSTATTGARQLARLAAAGLNVGMLPELRDMDHFSDALQIAAEIPGSAFAEAVAETAGRVPRPWPKAEAQL